MRDTASNTSGSTRKAMVLLIPSRTGREMCYFVTHFTLPRWIVINNTIAFRVPILITAGIALLLGAAPTQVQAMSGGTVTVSPAAIRLELAKGQQTASQSFVITNHYSVPVALHFALKRSGQQTDNTVDPRAQLALAQSDLTIPAGANAQQTITLQDSREFAPGSQMVDLVISQQQLAGQAGVSIVPSLHLPVTIIKYDGAVTSLALTQIDQTNMALQLPETTSVTIKNTGNMTAVPRGTVMVTAPGGKVVSRGVLNTASVAVSPGKSMRLTAHMTALGSAKLPGFYRTTVMYGLGGDNGHAQATTQFFYLSWWHMAIVALLAAVVWYGGRFSLRLLKRKPPTRQHGPPKRPAFSGRGVS